MKRPVKRGLLEITRNCEQGRGDKEVNIEAESGYWFSDNVDRLLDSCDNTGSRASRNNGNHRARSISPTSNESASMRNQR